MHKFSQLQSLSLYLDEEDPQFGAHLVNQLLHYVSTIDEIELYGFSLNRSNLMETIGECWEKTSKSGSENLFISYADYCSKPCLEMTKGSSGRKNWITLRYPTNEDFEWRSFMDFAKKRGKYIGVMYFEITFENDDNPGGRAELPEDFFPHLLNYCPNLTNLRFEGCVLRRFIYSDINLNKKFSLNELRLHCCDIEPGMLEQLSTLFHKIDQLVLYENRNYFVENVGHDEEYVHLNMNMPYTKVDRIVFLVVDESSEKTINLKALDTTDETCCFYQICASYHYPIKLSTEQEYAKPDGDHIFFSGSTRPEIEIKMLD